MRYYSSAECAAALIVMLSFSGGAQAGKELFYHSIDYDQFRGKVSLLEHYCNDPYAMKMLEACEVKNELPIIEKSGDGATCVQTAPLDMHKRYLLRARDPAVAANNNENGYIHTWRFQEPSATVEEIEFGSRC